MKKLGYFSRLFKCYASSKFITIMSTEETALLKKPPGIKVCGPPPLKHIKKEFYTENVKNMISKELNSAICNSPDLDELTVITDVAMSDTELKASESKSCIIGETVKQSSSRSFAVERCYWHDTFEKELSWNFYTDRKLAKQLKKKRKVSTKSEAKAKRVKKLPPNYFVAIQIGNRKIQECLQSIQNSIAEKEKLLSSIATSISKIHLTLMVLRLENEDDMYRAKCALEACQKMLVPQFEINPLVLEIEGLDSFNGQVLFAKVKQSEELDKLEAVADTVENCFKNHNFLSTDGKAFKPHITIMKLSKNPKIKKKGIKKINPELYEVHKDKRFGCQTVSHLQLCSMVHPQDKESGYYHVAHTVSLIAPSLFGDETLTTWNSKLKVNDTITHDLEKLKSEEITKNDDEVT